MPRKSCLSSPRRARHLLPNNRPNDASCCLRYPYAILDLPYGNSTFNHHDIYAPCLCSIHHPSIQTFSWIPLSTLLLTLTIRCTRCRFKPLPYSRQPSHYPSTFLSTSCTSCFPSVLLSEAIHGLVGHWWPEFIPFSYHLSCSQSDVD